jgi:hypothetical protein
MMMLVVYTTVLDGPSVSVEGPTQQGVESVMEVTPASGVTSDGSSDPPLRLRLLRVLRVVARTATSVVVVSVSVSISSSSRDALWWCRGHLWLRCRGRWCNALNLRVEFFFFFLLTKFRRYSLFSSRFAPSSQFQSSIATVVHIVRKQNLS